MYAVLYYNQVDILNYETGNLVQTIKFVNHRNYKITALSNHFSIAALPNSLLVTGHDLGELNIWDCNTNTQIREIYSQFRTKVCCIAELIDEQFVSGHQSGKLRIWNYQNGKHIKTLESYRCAVQCIVVLSTYLLASGYSNGCIKIWNYKTGKCIQTIIDEQSNDFLIYDKKLYLAKLSGKSLLRVDLGGKIEIWHYEHGIFTKAFGNSVSSKDIDIIGCTTNGNQIIISRRQSGLEIISFPPIKKVKEQLEAEPEPIKNNCLVM